MGGGGDSRIPSIISGLLAPAEADLVVRTYDFDPETASVQIGQWVKELRPDLIIGESLGSLHAICIKGIPHLLVSPALNAPLYFSVLAWLTLIPGVTWIFDRIYRPREGDRQSLHFTFSVLRKYSLLRKTALDNSLRNGSPDGFHAFFGRRDHYRKSSIVSIKTWKKYFGNTYDVYDGTHFMEDEYVSTILLDFIRKVLDTNK